jgi:undecaprenyl-diphosphatase
MRPSGSGLVAYPLRPRTSATPDAAQLTRLLYLLLAALGAFVALAAGYEHDPLATVDVEVAERVAAGMPGALEWTARPLSWLGGWIGLTVLGVVAGVLLVRERAWLDLAFFLTAFVGSQLVVHLLKEWFDRPRPDAGSAVPLPESASFPSGHATAGAASLGALAVLVAERLPSRRARVWLWSVVVVLGVAVGLSRIALNVHYVTDVLAGWCLGLAWLAACLLVRDAIRARGPGL